MKACKAAKMERRYGPTPSNKDMSLVESPHCKIRWFFKYPGPRTYNLHITTCAVYTYLSLGSVVDGA